MLHTTYKSGDLVLIHNNANEKTVSIDRKIQNRYMGPYYIVRETKGKSYVLEELNRNTLQASVVAFWLIPYVKQEHLDGWVWLIDAWDQGLSAGSEVLEQESRTEGEN